MKFSANSLLLAVFLVASVIGDSHAASCAQHKQLEEVRGFAQQVQCNCDSDSGDKLLCTQFDPVQQKEDFCVAKSNTCSSTDDCCGTWKCKGGTCMAAAAPAKGGSKIGGAGGANHRTAGKTGGGGASHRQQAHPPRAPPARTREYGGRARRKLRGQE